MPWTPISLERPQLGPPAVGAWTIGPLRLPSAPEHIVTEVRLLYGRLGDEPYGEVTSRADGWLPNLNWLIEDLRRREQREAQRPDARRPWSPDEIERLVKLKHSPQPASARPTRVTWHGERYDALTLSGHDDHAALVCTLPSCSVAACFRGVDVTDLELGAWTGSADLLKSTLPPMPT